MKYYSIPVVCAVTIGTFMFCVFCNNNMYIGDVGDKNENNSIFMIDMMYFMWLTFNVLSLVDNVCITWCFTRTVYLHIFTFSFISFLQKHTNISDVQYNVYSNAICCGSKCNVHI